MSFLLRPRFLGLVLTVGVSLSAPGGARADIFGRPVRSHQNPEHIYNLGRQIGQGGFGVVYEARMGRGRGPDVPRVAFKIWKPKLHRQFENLKGAFESAQRLCPDLCPLGLHRIIDVGTFEELAWPLRGVVSELGKGSGNEVKAHLSIADLSVADYNKARVRVQVLTEIFARLSKLQMALAQRNFALNDIKPPNFIISREHEFLLADFDTLFPVGARTGGYTSTYAAPEVLATGNSSPTSDQFSLAVSMFQYVTGGYTVADFLWQTYPELKPSKTRKTHAAVEAVYKRVAQEDPALSKTVGTLFNSIVAKLRLIQAEAEKKGEVPADWIDDAEALLDGIRSGLHMTADKRRPFTPRAATDLQKNQTRTFVSELFENDCKRGVPARAPIEKVGPRLIVAENLRGLDRTGKQGGGAFQSETEIRAFETLWKQDAHAPTKSFRIARIGEPLKLDPAEGRYFNGKSGFYLYLVDEYGSVFYGPDTVQNDRESIKHPFLYEFAKETARGALPRIRLGGEFLYDHAKKRWTVNAASARFGNRAASSGFTPKSGDRGLQDVQFFSDYLKSEKMFMEPVKVCLSSTLC